MASYFDDNDLRDISEESLRYFYEEYSASIRKQLIGKNLISPQSVYDVLYPRTKEALLAKNIPKETNLEENSKTIRDSLIAKLVAQNLDIEKMSEDTRKSLIARNKIILDAENILRNAENIRKVLLSKNQSNDINLLSDSYSARQNNINKNNINPSLEKNFEKDSSEFRTNNLNKNITTDSDLLGESQAFRENIIRRNDYEAVDIEKASIQFRENNLNKNDDEGKSIEELSIDFRNKNQSKNNPSAPFDLLDSSETFRVNNISKNEDSTFDLTESGNSAREIALRQNISSEGDLEKDSSAFRNKNIVNNESSINLSDISEKIREKNVSRNTEGRFNLQAFAEEIRNINISKNKSSNGDLLKDSDNFRKQALASIEKKDSDLLNSSSEYLKNNTTNNLDTADLLSDSESFRNKNIVNNTVESGDLLSDSEEFLKKNKSLNTPNENNLDNISDSIRKENTASNKKVEGDLLNDSEQFLNNNTSLNKTSEGNLLNDSEQFLSNNTSANIPVSSDLLNDSEQFLSNNTSANIPVSSDLLNDSEQFYQNNIAPNVPVAGDLLSDSVEYMQNNISANVPSNGDLLNDSNSYWNSNMASNISSDGDLLSDSNSYWNSNMASNISSDGDLLSDSVDFLHNNQNSNVPNNSDLLSDSYQLRDNLISANNSIKPFNLEQISKNFRDNNLSANPPSSQLGIVVEGIGTSTFLGVSRVLLQGLVLRQVLLSKNKKSKYNLDKFISAYSLDKTSSTDAKNSLISKNQFQLSNKEYGTFSANLIKGDKTSILGSTVRELIQGQYNNNQYYNNSIAGNLQNKYGNNVIDSFAPASVGGGFFSIDTVGPKGGYFSQQDAMQEVKFDIKFKKGSITDAIRNYNLSRNLYNIYKLTPGDLQSLGTLQQNNDEGFQDLLAKTVGSLKGNNSVGAQLQGNLIPRGILVANEGAYIKGGSPENILRPQQGQGMEIGTAESMMSKTVAGNPFFDTEFQAGTKGVKHIMKTIRNSSAADFTINYDVQNSKKFVIGINNDGSPKVSRQRFTVANPYKPGNAKTLLFYLQNYSSGEGFYFPPYIENFSDSFGANWNSNNFLGRPEPIFTYNNSSREGSLTFFVLTDYTQNLVIGRNFKSDSLDEVKVNPRVHFTSKDVNQNEKKKLAFNQNEAKQQEINKTAQEYQAYNNIASGGTPEQNILQQDIKGLQKDANSVQGAQNSALVTINKGNVYSETNNVIGNVNNFMTSLPSRDAGDIDTKAEDSKKRIDQMIQNLAFQPAFFSGDKVDFATKMEFLAKMTRPAKADEGSGFSYTRPPVCHIHLGDWWHSDIIVDNVSFNYTDAPWTLDDGRVQPMWASVTLSFKFIGTYRAERGGPVLSDDKGGFYQTRT